MADRDLGLHYRLSIIKRNGELVLVGISNRERNAPTIEIGRTNGTNSGFSKIVLGKSWRFTKRTFEDKTLGHVYLSSNLAPPVGIPTPVTSRAKADGLAL